MHTYLQGVGRHPALGSEKMTSEELAQKIVAEEPHAKTPRHDEVWWHKCMDHAACV